MEEEKFLCSGCLFDFPFTDPAFRTDDFLLSAFDETWRPERLHTLFYYNKFSDYRQLIYAVKYHSKKDLGVYLGEMLGERMKGKTEADCIVPIPLHPKREKKRGFNQAYQIAWGIHRKLNLEVLNGVVARGTNNVTQTGKNAEERRKNVEHIFQLLLPEQITGRHVLLVDDVVTTGATTASCLQELSAAGNVTFSLACLALARGI